MSIEQDDVMFVDAAGSNNTVGVAEAEPQQEATVVSCQLAFPTEASNNLPHMVSNCVIYCNSYVKN